MANKARYNKNISELSIITQTAMIVEGMVSASSARIPRTGRTLMTMVSIAFIDDFMVSASSARIAITCVTAYKHASSCVILVERSES